MDWRIQRALRSFRNLLAHIEDLTEEEVYIALKFECETMRRSSVIDRLVAKAADFNRQTFVAQLKEKIHGTNQIRSSVQV